MDFIGWTGISSVVYKYLDHNNTHPGPRAPHFWPENGLKCSFQEKTSTNGQWTPAPMIKKFKKKFKKIKLKKTSGLVSGLGLLEKLQNFKRLNVICQPYIWGESIWPPSRTSR